MSNDNFQIRIFDDQTGAVLPLDKRASDMKQYVLSISDDAQRSKLLSKVNYVRKLVETAEKALKSFIKESVSDTDFDDDGVAMWQDFKLKKVITDRFDKKHFEANASTDELEVYKKWKAIEDKYKKPSVSIRI